MNKVEIITTSDCPFCTLAKDLLIDHGVQYVELDLRESHYAKQTMIKHELKTVPQIFIDHQLLEGGYEGLNQYFTTNEYKFDNVYGVAV